MDTYTPAMSSRIDTASEILLTIAQAVFPTNEEVEQFAISDDASVKLENDEVSVSCSFYTSAYYLRATNSEMGEEESEKLAAVESHNRLKVIRRAIGGRWDKDYCGSYLQYTQEVNGVNVTLECDRGATCKKIVKGVEEIPEQIVPQKVIPARTREIVEWECN